MCVCVCVWYIFCYVFCLCVLCVYVNVLFVKANQNHLCVIALYANPLHAEWREGVGIKDYHVVLICYIPTPQTIGSAIYFFISLPVVCGLGSCSVRDRSYLYEWYLNATYRIWKHIPLLHRRLTSPA